MQHAWHVGSSVLLVSVLVIVEVIAHPSHQWQLNRTPSRQTFSVDASAPEVCADVEENDAAEDEDQGKSKSSQAADHEKRTAAANTITKGWKEHSQNRKRTRNNLHKTSLQELPSPAQVEFAGAKDVAGAGELKSKLINLIGTVRDPTKQGGGRPCSKSSGIGAGNGEGKKPIEKPTKEASIGQTF